MKSMGSYRLALVTGAAVLVTAVSGIPVAAAQQAEDGCGPEVELGAIVYKGCSDLLLSNGTQYGTQSFLYARNRGFGSVTVTATLERWNYTTSSWEPDTSGTKTIAAGGDTRFFSPSNGWPCGQDARERVRATTTVGTGAWSEVVTPAAC